MPTNNSWNSQDPAQVAKGGTGAATLTGVLTGNGTSPVTANSITQYGVLVGGASNAVSSLSVGSSGQILQSSGAGVNPAYSTATYPSTATSTGTLLRANGTNWAATTSTYPDTNAINTLLYASSANVMSALATANNGVLITSATGVPSVLAAGTTGQVLTATTGSPPSWATAASGDVTGPGSSTDNALARWDGTGGTAIQNSTVIVTDAGEMTNASQVAFLAYPSASITNVTGDGTSYTVAFNAEIFDQNSDYNTGTATFTASVTGKYYLHSGILFNDLTSSHTGSFVSLIGSNRNFICNQNAGGSRNSSNQYHQDVIGFLDMDSADTVTIQVQVSGGTKVVDIQAPSAGDMRSLFEGCLLC
jgi:hypothetical protein